MINTLACMIYDPIGPLGKLSNYASTPITVDGVEWPTVEHYYQAAKYNESHIKDVIRLAPSPEKAKAEAWKQSPTLPEGWETTGVETMERALRCKFAAYPAVSDLLIMTGTLPIFEDSPDDNYWGIGEHGRGKNTMGKILMKLRNEMQSNKSSSASLVQLAERPAFHKCSRYARVVINRPLDAGHSNLPANESDLVRIQIPEILEHMAANFDNDLSRERLAKAFDEKYSNYRWDDDARSIIPGWFERANSFFAETQNIVQGKSLVLGAGAGEETAKLWAHMNADMILSDVGPKLCDNIEKQLPNSQALQAVAQDLSQIPSNSISRYIALRVFQSYGFDKWVAAKEAGRVLREDGLAIISIANGYKDSKVGFLKGLIDSSGVASETNAYEELCRTVEAFERENFFVQTVEDWQSELVLLMRRKGFVSH